MEPIYYLYSSLLLSTYRHYQYLLLRIHLTSPHLASQLHAPNLRHNPPILIPLRPLLINLQHPPAPLPAALPNPLLHRRNRDPGKNHTPDNILHPGPPLRFAAYTPRCLGAALAHFGPLFFRGFYVRVCSVEEVDEASGFGFGGFGIDCESVGVGGLRGGGGVIVDLGEGGEFFVWDDRGQGDREEGPHA